MHPLLWIGVLTRDKYTCQACGSVPPDVKIRIAHIVPAAKGGKNVSTNCCVVCQPCYDQRPSQWRKQLKRFQKTNTH